MTRIAKLALFAAAAFAAQPAAASVRYTYNLGIGNSFVYTAPSFITARTAIPAAKLDSCKTIAAFGACTYAQLLPTGTSFNRPDNSVVIFTTEKTGNIFSYFALGALGTPGFYTDTVILGRNDTLNVALVPEPAALGALALGVGLLGATRRRKA